MSPQTNTVPTAPAAFTPVTATSELAATITLPSCVCP